MFVTYRGAVFPSKNEARWAVLLDYLGIAWLRLNRRTWVPLWSVALHYDGRDRLPQLEDAETLGAPILIVGRVERAEAAEVVRVDPNHANCRRAVLDVDPVLFGRAQRFARHALKPRIPRRSRYHRKSPLWKPQTNSTRTRQ